MNRDVIKDRDYELNETNRKRTKRIFFQTSKKKHENFVLK